MTIQLQSLPAFGGLGTLPPKEPQPALPAASPYILTWETDVEAHIRHALEQRNPDKPFMVAICGIPGSGKSTSSEMLQAQLNDVGCALLPADGYHYYRDYLMSQPNSADLIWKRGAPNTFDAVSLVHDLTNIRNGTQDYVWIPGFDHANGDPTPAAHCFRRQQHKVVLCEGLYLLHDGDGFEHVRDLFDLTIYVEANLDLCMQRLKIRNRCIPGYTPAEINHRVDSVDRSNALTVERSAIRADLAVPSATSVSQ